MDEITTQELLDELMRRFETAVFIGIPKALTPEFDYQLKSVGPLEVRLGLLSIYQHTALIDLAPGLDETDKG